LTGLRAVYPAINLFAGYDTNSRGTLIVFALYPVRLKACPFKAELHRCGVDTESQIRNFLP